MKGAIWCYDISSGREKLDEIRNQYIQCGFFVEKEIRNNYYDSYIIFNNGDMWRLLKASDNFRGYKLNVSYIDCRIDDEIINCIIKPCTIAMPYQAIHYF